MEIIRAGRDSAAKLAPLTAGFRTALNSYRGVVSQPDVPGAYEELMEYFDRGFPIYAAEEDGEFTGYIVCRIDEPCVWVEQLFVRSDRRRAGVASALFSEAERIAASMGEDTVFNFIHPNNEGVIRFLRSRGYTVLNMIEVRKPYAGEKLKKITVGENSFDY